MSAAPAAPVERARWVLAVVAASRARRGGEVARLLMPAVCPASVTAGLAATTGGAKAAAAAVAACAALTAELRAAWPQFDPNDAGGAVSTSVIDVVVGVAAANALRAAIAAEPAAANDGAGSGATAASEDPRDRAVFRLLLFAFDRFQALHSMSRSAADVAPFPQAAVTPPASGYSVSARAQAKAAASPAARPVNYGWDTAVLVALVHAVQAAARRPGAADEESLNGIVRGWRRLFLFLQDADRGQPSELSRARGALAVVNGLLTMLFQHGNTHQCRALLANVQHIEAGAARQNQPPSPHSAGGGGSSGSGSNGASGARAPTFGGVLAPCMHMRSEVVKYLYYSGRMALYERRFGDAFEALRRAHAMMPPLAALSEASGTAGAAALPAEGLANKRRVWFYWAVAGVVSGHVPPPALLLADPYTAALLAPVVAALRAGSVGAFVAAVDAHGAVFRRRGCYLMLLRARPLCYLMLLQRLHAALAAAGADASRVPLRLLLAAAEAVDPSILPSQAAADRAAAAETASASSAASAPPAKRGRLEDLAPGVAPPAALAACATESDGGADGDGGGWTEAETAERLDALAVWVARLATRGLVKGYVSYEHQTIVLSKQTPFPTVVGKSL